MVFIPKSISAGSNPLIRSGAGGYRFAGNLEVEFQEPLPGRSFQFKQTHRLHPPVNGIDGKEAHAVINKPSGPPQHFHPYQNEYFQVIQGRMALGVNDRSMVVTPDDGEMRAMAGDLHRFYMAPDSTEDLIVEITSSDPARDYQLDRVFMENWYGMWHDCVMHGKDFDMIQLLSMYDAGGSYLPGPSYLPFRRTIGILMGVVIGRWIGGLLGYRPFHKEYTTDWDYAVAKMRSSVCQRHLADSSYSLAKPWTEMELACRRKKGA
ncbi:MAG: hypothetical protein M1819_002065 [Sarea resinae]|nr:MAG: hypothetical protein M1819_002065 [Sarea resinae]